MNETIYCVDGCGLHVGGKAHHLTTKADGTMTHVWGRELIQMFGMIHTLMRTNAPVQLHTRQSQNTTCKTHPMNVEGVRDLL